MYDRATASRGGPGYSEVSEYAAACDGRILRRAPALSEQGHPRFISRLPSPDIGRHPTSEGPPRPRPGSRYWTTCPARPSRHGPGGAHTRDHTGVGVRIHSGLNLARYPGAPAGIFRVCSAPVRVSEHSIRLPAQPEVPTHLKGRIVNETVPAVSCSKRCIARRWSIPIDQRLG